eukprot:4690208-Pleurochrysis_carterae.AAC.5
MRLDRIRLKRPATLVLAPLQPSMRDFCHCLDSVNTANVDQPRLHLVRQAVGVGDGARASDLLEQMRPPRVHARRRLVLWQQRRRVVHRPKDVGAALARSVQRELRADAQRVVRCTHCAAAVAGRGAVLSTPV